MKQALSCWALLLGLLSCVGAISIPARIQSHTPPLSGRLRDLPDGAALQLRACDGSFHQQWNGSYLSTDQTIRLQYDNKCMDISGYGTSDGSGVWLFSCHTSDKDPSHQNQEWTFKNGALQNPESGKCLASQGLLVIWDCSGGPEQQWAFNSTDNTMRNVQTGLCVDAGSPIPRACDNSLISGFPMCNVSLPIDTRVADLVGRIQPSEKVALFGNGAGGVPSLNLPAYQWWSEALHGVAGSPGVSFSPPTPVATSFPQVCTTGASFDTDLFAQIGQVISTEARAFDNAGHAGLTFWAPNLNIFRDPRWGRGQETVGEDPYLTSQYVKNFVHNMQYGEDPNHLKVSSCCKHYAAYSLENWNGVTRHAFDAIVTDQDLLDTYFPAFESCISPDGGSASGIMCSYNAVNGIPSCANYYLLTTMARDTWNFDGYITGDCGAVDDVIYSHHYTSTADATCLAVLEAGMDIDCGGFLQGHLQDAINDNTVNMTLVDRALSHLFRVQMRLGIFDPVSNQPYLQLNASDVVNTPASQQLALTAALEGMVLLQNNGNTLPLAKNQTVALIGPNAMATSTLQGNYYGNAPYLISPHQGIQKYATVNYAQGCDIATNDTSNFEAACTAAKNSQKTILVVGLDESQESEGNDRVSISFPGAQEQLIAQIADCSARPVVVVVLSGGHVDLTMVKANPKVGAIMWAGYPGQSGGDAIAMVLFGDYSPAGRLVSSVMPADFINEVPLTDMGMRPNATSKNPGRTYRFFTGDLVFPFGWGISYTTFSYQPSSDSLSISLSSIQADLNNPQITALNAPALGNLSVVVTNTGQVTSDTVVLAFISSPSTGQNGSPIKSLFGFTRLHSLTANQKQTVTFPVTAFALSEVQTNGLRASASGAWKVMIEDAAITINVQ